MSKRSTSKRVPAKPLVPDEVDWRDFDPSCLPGGQGATLATELVTYRDRLDELLEHRGEFVVIKEKSILGFYRHRQAALAAAHQAYGAVPVLVKQVVEKEPVRRLGNGLL
jgi:hypothetical protein